MVNLPTRDSLGGLPQARSGGIASVSVPSAPRVDISGIANLGRGIAAIGDAATSIEGHRQKQDEFEVERRFQEFEWQQRQALDQSMRNVEPGAAREFADGWQKTYIENGKEFFKNVPDALKPKYEARLFQAEKNLYGTAATFARTEQKRHSTNTVTDLTNSVFAPRARVAATVELDNVGDDFDKVVDANPDLTPIEKDELKRQGRRAIARAHVDGLPPDQVSPLIGTGTQPVTPEGLLRRFEGFREGAYWDVNAWRVGYGSDTVTLADGSVVKVTKETKVTREDAERDLARRTKEFASVVERQVGPDLWSQMPANVRAALTSVAYNYGSLPKTVVQAAQTNDPRRVAEAVKALPANQGRRRQEADIILGGSGLPSILSSLTDDDREKLIVNAERERERIERFGEQRRTQLADAYLKEAFSLAAEGQLTAEYVETIRPMIKATEYKNLLKTLSAEDNVDDKDAVADLVRRIDTETPDSFQRLAGSYMADGKLKTATFVSLSEKNRTASRDDQPSSPYRSGRDLIRNTLDPGQLLSGAAATIARHGMAQALEEFDTWAAANPRASRADSSVMAHDIVRRYAVLDTSQMRLAIGVSRYFGGQTRADIQIQHVDEAEKKLFADREAGRLTPEQYAFEIRLLENWRGLLAREATQQGGDGGGPKR